jgi:hypothetical protein
MRLPGGAGLGTYIFARSQATFGPMHQARRDGLSGEVIHHETL